MKMWKKCLTLFTAVALLFSLSAGSVMAAEEATVKDSYRYTVTFFAGNVGTFAEDAEVIVSNPDAVIARLEDQIIVSGLNLGDKVGMNAQSAVMLGESSKYYAKGIRLSGRDNTTVAASVFTVEEDADYVVAYGIKGNQVSYTINYQHENGTELAPGDTFYGNIGDKPVIAYKYIDGYVPKAIGLTKTLSADASENVFTFIYVNRPTPTYREEVTEVTKEVITEKVEDVVVIVPGSSGGSGSQTSGGTDEEDPDDGEDTGEGTGSEGSGSEGAGSEGTDEGEGTGSEDSDDGEGDVIVDLDDEDVPLSDMDPVVDRDTSLFTYIAVISASVVALIVLVGLYFLLKKRSKAAEEGASEDGQ